MGKKKIETFAYFNKDGMDKLRLSVTDLKFINFKIKKPYGKEEK